MRVDVWGLFYVFVPGSSETEQGVGIGIQLHVATGRWRRRMCWWQQQLIIVHLLCVSGASADTKKPQVAHFHRWCGRACLGSQWRSHHAAVELTLCQPRRDLQWLRGVQIWHKGWVLNPTLMKEKNWISTSGFNIGDIAVLCIIIIIFIQVTLLLAAPFY